MMEKRSNKSLSGAAWMKIILNRPEKDVAHMLQKEPGLVSKAITMVCLGQLKVTEKPECDCSGELETLQGSKGQTLAVLVFELHNSVSCGACPHVLAILRNYDGTRTRETEPVEESVQDMVVRLYYKRYMKSTDVDTDSMPESNDCTKQYQHHMLQKLIPYSCTASISVIHIATALGKLKLLQNILSDSITPVGSLCLHFESGYHSVSPFHIAVIHGQYEQIKIIRRKFPRMICNMDRHFGRDNATPSTLAAKRNDVLALQLLLKDKDSCKGGRNSLALLMALEQKSLGCAEFLIKQRNTALNNTLWYQSMKSLMEICDPTLSVLTRLLKQRETDLLKLVVDNACIPVVVILSVCIYYDDTEMTEYLLSSTKAISHIRDKMHLLKMATFKNSPDMLKILVKFFKRRKTVMGKTYSALTWAKVLQYDACVNVLKKATRSADKHDEGHDMIIEATHPFPALMLERSISFDISIAFERLVELGYDINELDEFGNTCLSLGIDDVKDPGLSGAKRDDLVSRMLELGADVFTFTIRPRIFPASIVLRLLDANVDVCRGNHYCRSAIENVERLMMLLILRTAHTINKMYVDFLRYQLDESEENTPSRQQISEHITEYIDTPQPLLRLCRNSIRRTTGIHIHRFLKSQPLPRRIVNILSLRDDLEPYCHYNDGKYWYSPI